MKTFQQFCEDAASNYEAGMRAYQSSAPARLAARRQEALKRSRKRASSFQQRSLARVARIRQADT